MRNFLFGLLISMSLFAGYMVYVGNVDLEFKFGYTTANAKIESQMAEIEK